MEGVRITVHFHGGTTAVTTLTGEDIEDLLGEIRETNRIGGRSLPASDVGDYVEYALTYSGKPTFRWLGDIYLHPQAVTGVELLDLPLEDN